MPSVRIKRGTRAQIDAAALAGGLFAGEVYLITDENRLAVGLTASTYQDFAKTSESGIGSYTFATLPSASANSGRVAVVTDIGYGGSLWRSNGATWEPTSAIDLRKASGTINCPAGTAEGVRDQILIPGGLLKVGSVLDVEGMVTKSGATEGLSLYVRIGSAGTVADAAVLSSTSMITNTNRTSRFTIPIRLAGATSAESVSIASQPAASGVTTNTPTAITIPTISSDLYLSVTTKMSASTETAYFSRLVITLRR